ncbi:MAG: hypothetical protein ACM31C_04670 [Acidobacteriota bacterium]
MSVSRGMVLFLVAACGSNNTDNLPPPGTGTTDAGVRIDATSDGTTTPKDGTPSEIDAAIINGRVCLVTADPRHIGLDPASDCATTGANGLTVRLGDKVTTTADDGSFSIDAPATLAGAIWSVTGSSIVSSYKVFSDYQIPAFTTALYSSMLSANGVIPLPGQGSVIAQLVSNGAGATGMIGLSTPTSEYSAFFDGSTATTFQQTSSGSAGIMWLAGIDVGEATVTAGPPTFPNQFEITTPTQPIADGSLTFVTITFP